MQPTGANVSNVARSNILDRPQQGPPTGTAIAQEPVLGLVRQHAVETPPQPPPPLLPPDTHELQQWPATQFRHLFPDAKAIVLSYLPGGEIRIFVDPELWALVRDSPPVDAFLRATQRHAQYSALHAGAELDLKEATGQYKTADQALTTTNKAVYALARALSCATLRLGSPEHDEALRKHEAAVNAHETGLQSFSTAGRQQVAARKERESASNGIDSAHSKMRKHLEEIRWVGSDASMHALGFVIDYSDRRAPLDPAAARQEQAKADEAAESKRAAASDQ